MGEIQTTFPSEEHSIPYPVFATEEERMEWEASEYRRWDEIKENILAKVWLKLALPPEEFQDTIGIDPSNLAALYPDVFLEGPYALEWNRLLSKLAHHQNLALSRKSAISKPSIDLLKEFIDIYGGEFSDELNQNIYTLAKDSLRISNYWVDIDSYYVDADIPITRFYYHRAFDDKKAVKLGFDISKIGQATENFCRLVLMKDLIASFRSVEPMIVAHENFIAKL